MVKIQKLTYKSLSADQIKPYKDRLDVALSDESASGDNGIKNIAVTGIYGSGKSSVIHSYFDNHSSYNKKVLYVSLSNHDVKVKMSEKQLEDLQERILNQIIHQIPLSKIVLSRVTLRRHFFRKFSFWTKFIGMSILIFLWSLSQPYVSVNLLNDIFLQDKELLFFLTSLTFVILLLWFLARHIMRYGRVFVSKLKLFDVELTFFDGKDDLVFDRMFDEIYYLFLKANADFFVFEDLERFNNPEIFIKLRELNTQINRKMQVNKHSSRVIRFIYITRNDIFNQEKEKPTI